jgi:hypothetical protein
VLFTGRKSWSHATAYGLGPLAELSAGQRVPRPERAGITPAHPIALGEGRRVDFRIVFLIADAMPGQQHIATL